MATTPPLRIASITQPPTPLHGGRYDNHRYPPRKSTRYPITRTRCETPPHSHLQRKSNSAHPTKTISPPSSTQTSPNKQPTKCRLSTYSNHMESTDHRLLKQHSGFKNTDVAQAPCDSSTTAMLPTPAKTPAKKPVHAAAINGAARVLFPVRPDTVEEAMPKLRKSRPSRRQVGFSLYSSMEDEGANAESNIQIFTDSKEKVPELDLTEDNPFLEQPLQAPPIPEPSKGRNSRKRKASHGIESNSEIKEAFDRDNGMVYVFRGKKIFRKFPEDETDRDDDSALEIEDADSSRLRPLNRSSIKPRLLFPTPSQRAERSASAIEDEEAPTDIEDPGITNPEDAKVVTPVKQSFQPSTPPPTGHATRSSTKKARLDSSSPADSIGADDRYVVKPADSEFKVKKISPFDTWHRTKAGGHTGKGKKREAEALESNGGISGRKKFRNDDSL